MSQTFLDSFISTIQASSAYNADDQTAPVAVLWTDKERQWEALLPLLRGRLPLLTCGVYDPATRTGPAYWLRAMLARALPEDRLPPEVTPIIYLPGVSRQEIRAVEDCPRELQPLAELQYRGLLWSQRNAKDWTVAAFLQAELNIEVAADQATREALLRALPKLSESPLEVLRQQAPIKAAWLDALLNPDEVRSLLGWMDHPAGYRQQAEAHAWQSFISLCRQKYRLDPERDGELTATELLGNGGDAWDVVWERYKESPQSYPQIARMLAQVAPPAELFDLTERWPTHNESAEEQLRLSLEQLAKSASQSDAHALLKNLEAAHAPRRTWVWAKLGQSPLAQALEPLTQLSLLSERPIGANLGELAANYREWAWQVDAAALSALALSENAVVKSAVRALYKPWLEAATRQFQRAVQDEGYPYRPFPRPQPGTCLLFSDALRLDAAQTLAELLRQAELQVHLEGHWAALPPVTSTSKPAFSPDQHLLNGQTSRSLSPTLAGRESPLTADSLRSLLADQGFQILRGDELGADPSGLGWTELGRIDSYGHEHGVKLAQHLAAELQGLSRRVADLLVHGWARVQVVTDHGWLLLPGGLPKAHLPEHLTELRKGRCARLKESARTEYFTASWHWDNSVSVAYAPDIQCFEAGKEYEHGGLSLQECYTPMLTVEPAGVVAEITISEIKWRGLRCNVQLSIALPNLKVDLRTRPADPSTSLLAAPKSPDENGQVSLTVENDDLSGQAAVLVVLDDSGQLIAQMPTLVGG